MGETGTTLPKDSTGSPSTDKAVAEAKGKGKAVTEHVPKHDDQDDDDDDDDDDEDDEDEGEENADAGDDEDGMEEIDLDNIVEGGRRTRGAKIDFAKAAEENPVDEDEDEDDDDFQPPPEDTEMSG